LKLNKDWIWLYEHYPYNVPNGTYNVIRHEVTATVQFENAYPIPPLVQGIANGFSAANPNNGRCFMEVVNVTETEATVRTYVYEVVGSGGTVWLPTSPSDVRFHIAVMRDNFSKEVYLQNKVEGATKNYTALTTIAAGRKVTTEIPVGDYIINNGGKVSLHAGEAILLSDGFYAMPGSYLKTHIEPFFFCEHKASAPENRNNQEQTFVISDYTVEKTATEAIAEGDYYLKLYPNPSAGDVTIEYNLSRSELVEISLFDNFGKLVYQLKNRTPHEAGVYKITLTGVELQNGIYLCTLKTETGQKTEKLIIAR